MSVTAESIRGYCHCHCHANHSNLETIDIHRDCCGTENGRSNGADLAFFLKFGGSNNVFLMQNCTLSLILSCWWDFGRAIMPDDRQVVLVLVATINEKVAFTWD